MTLLVPAFIILIVALPGCRGSEQRTPSVNRPSVILISIDTLRADRVGGPLTPNINALRQDAVSFERAFSHVPQTLPSHTCIMTGLLPQHSGVRDNIGYGVNPGQPILAALLKENGYATGAAVSSYVLRRATGLDRGFDVYDDHLEYRSSTDVTAERNGERTLQALEQWMAGSSSSPLFAFLHLYEPHAPYVAPAAYSAGKTPYDGEVAYADSIVGRFVAELKRRGLYDDALIVLLSDHGEGLGEHGEDEHGVFVYREALAVPLIMKLPRGQRAGQRVTKLAALTDVLPTILGVVGIAAPRGDGVDLFAQASSERRIYAESYFPLLHLHWHELTSLIDESHQYIDAPRSELYDLGADPQERRNVAGADRRRSFAMAALLKPMVMFQPPGRVDAEDQRKLAALGYIGSVSAASSGDFPDPKDRIQYVRLFRQAETLVASRPAVAVPILQQLTKENPALVDEWVLLARAYDRTGRHAAAIDTLRKASGLFPGSAAVSLPLAGLLSGDRRFDEARAQAELALKEDPVLAHEMLARIALERGSIAQARAEIDLAIAAAPRRVTTLMAAATIAGRAEDWTSSLSFLDRAAVEAQGRGPNGVRDLQARRGEALLHLQRGEEAERAFRAETQAFPDNLPAWGNLAVIVAVQGRGDEAQALLRQAMAANPGPAAQAMVRETLSAIGK